MIVLFSFENIAGWVNIAHGLITFRLTFFIMFPDVLILNICDKLKDEKFLNV